MERPKKISIVMAVYNEKDSILEVLHKIKDVRIGLNKEIIIVDGCSHDGTREILKALDDPRIKVLFEEQRNGKGAALRLGFSQASGDIILIQDADREIDPYEYPLLLEPILKGESEVVFGSRFKKGRGKTDPINYLGNRFVTWVANTLFAAHLTDIETCYKLFKRGIIAGMRFSCSGFDFDAELTSLILKKGISISEVPISYNPRSKDEGKKLHWTVVLPSLLAIIRCRFAR